MPLQSQSVVIWVSTFVLSLYISAAVQLDLTTKQDFGQPINLGHRPLRIGLLSTANINAEAMLEPVSQNPDFASITAIASRDVKNAWLYKFKVGDILKNATVFNSYQDLLDHADIDSVYNPLPNGLHYEWTMKALQAGKHVLCEKPFASNAEEARIMTDLANKKGLVLMEGLHWFYHPFRQRMQDIIHSGILGDVRKISTKFIQDPGVTKFGPQIMGWRFDSSQAGGTMMDLGTYILHLMRVLMDDDVPVLKWAKAQRSPLDPEIDMSMEGEAIFPNSGVTGTFLCSFLGPDYNASAVVEGSKGIMLGEDFHKPQGGNHIIVKDFSGKQLLEESVPGSTTFTYQLQAFANYVWKAQEGNMGAMKTHTMNLGSEPVVQMELLDRAYELAGMKPRSGPSRISADLKH